MNEFECSDRLLRNTLVRWEPLLKEPEYPMLGPLTFASADNGSVARSSADCSLIDVESVVVLLDLSRV